MPNSDENVFSINDAMAQSSIIFRNDFDCVIRIDGKGFHYRGQFIEDAGEAHRLLVEFLHVELEAQQKNRHHSAMNISEAINVMESVAGVTDESTSVGEAWAVILSHVMHSQKRKDVNPRSENV